MIAAQAGAAEFLGLVGALLEAGEPPIRAIAAARTGARGKPLRAVAAEMCAEAALGKTLGAVVGARREVFGSFAVELVKAGESKGHPAAAAAGASRALASFRRVAHGNAAVAWAWLALVPCLGWAAFVLAAAPAEIARFVHDLGAEVPITTGLFVGADRLWPAPLLALFVLAIRFARARRPIGRLVALRALSAALSAGLSPEEALRHAGTVPAARSAARRLTLLAHDARSLVGDLVELGLTSAESFARAVALVAHPRAGELFDRVADRLEARIVEGTRLLARRSAWCAFALAFLITVWAIAALFLPLVTLQGSCA